MNSFFICYKQNRADEIMRALSNHIDETIAQYLPCSMSEGLVKAVSLYCNDYNIEAEEGDYETFKKIRDL